jgi:hypothetical protein
VRSDKLARLFLATIIVGLPCSAAAITTDGKWYNFWNLTAQDVFATNGTSCEMCADPYFAPGNPPWTFTILNGFLGTFTITDGGHQGDVFSVFNNGSSLIGQTPIVAVDTNHSCGFFPTACLADTAMSHASFTLAPGTYSITIREDQFFEPSSVSWFRVTTTANSDGSPGGLPAAVPEPGTFALIGSALIGAGILRRRRASSRA